MAKRHSTYDWFSTKEVTRFVMMKIWSTFRYPLVDGKRILWEPGFMEMIVDVALHGEEAPQHAQAFYRKRDRTDTEATRYIVFQATQVIESLVKKCDLRLLLLMGLGQVPQGPKYTLHAMLVKEAAMIYEQPEERFHRRFERAFQFIKRHQAQKKEFELQRLKEIGMLGRFSSRHRRIAAMYPKISQVLDQALRDRDQTRRQQSGTPHTITVGESSPR